MAAKTKTLTVNVDLDGVVVDFPAAFMDMMLFADPVRFRTIQYPTVWDWWPQWGMTFTEWKHWFERGTRDGTLWRRGPAVQGASKALWRLNDAGYNIRIVTNRLSTKGQHTAAITDTVEWLDEHAIPYRNISFEVDKQSIRADIVIDDRPSLDWVQEGALNILFDRPYNQMDILPKGVVRAHGWDEVLYIIKEHEGEI